MLVDLYTHVGKALFTITDRDYGGPFMTAECGRSEMYAQHNSF
jgi:hypothetical protein